MHSHPWEVKNLSTGQIVEVKAFSAELAVLFAAEEQDGPAKSNEYEVCHNLRSVNCGPWVAWRDGHAFVREGLEQEEVFA